MKTKSEIMQLFDDDVATRKRLIREFVMNDNNSYEDRLEVWEKTPEHLQEHQSYTWHHPTLDDDAWLDTDYVERHQYINLTSVPEWHDWTEPTIKEFYEGCMQDGIWSFTFDW